MTGRVLPENVWKRHKEFHIPSVNFHDSVQARTMTSVRQPTDRPIIALPIETSNALSRELLHGIRDWKRTHRSWAIRLSEQGRGGHPPVWLKTWHGDGIIARIEPPEIEEAVLRTRVPVVNVSASGP
jgi:hypothetical protein